MKGEKRLEKEPSGLPPALSWFLSELRSVGRVRRSQDGWLPFHLMLSPAWLWLYLRKKKKNRGILYHNYNHHHHPIHRDKRKKKRARIIGRCKKGGQRLLLYRSKPYSYPSSPWCLILSLLYLCVSDAPAVFQIFFLFFCCFPSSWCRCITGRKESHDGMREDMKEKDRDNQIKIPVSKHAWGVEMIRWWFLWISFRM